MRFEDLRYRNRTILAILNLYVAPMPPLNLGLVRISVWEAKSFEDFPDGHLGCRNGLSLAVLNLYVSPMPPIKFQFIPNYPSGADVVSRFSIWRPW